MRRWLRRGRPGVAARAKAEGGAFFRGGETGLRSDDVRGRSYAPRGRTPEVLVDHGRASLGLISAVTDKGELRWMVLDGAVKAPSLLRFQTTTCDASSSTAPGPCLGRTGQIAADAAMRAR